MLQDREVLRGMAGADARVVLVHRDIQHPLEAVLNGPVAAHGAGEVCRVGGEARDEVAGSRVV